MSARSYCLGLPVVVTIADDGSVSYWIDTAEVGSEIRDSDQGEASGEVLSRDAKAADVDHYRLVYRNLVRTIGRGFHPDTRGDDYRLAAEVGLSAPYIDRVIAAAEEAGVDVYAEALSVFETLPPA